MVRVDDLDAARDFYRDRLGLIELWRDDTEPAAGMALPESDAEVVLHMMDLPQRVEVHYLVDSVERSVAELEANGVRMVRRPFDIAIGKCAVFLDPSNNAVCILDMTKGPR